jgi:hypothetical protein
MSWIRISNSTQIANGVRELHERLKVLPRHSLIMPEY